MYIRAWSGHVCALRYPGIESHCVGRTRVGSRLAFRKSISGTTPLNATLPCCHDCLFYPPRSFALVYSYYTSLGFRVRQLDRYIENAAVTEVETQFGAFREIINMYILPGSEMEVNIETAMRNKILKVQ